MLNAFFLGQPASPMFYFKNFKTHGMHIYVKIQGNNPVKMEPFIFVFKEYQSRNILLREDLHIIILL